MIKAWEKELRLVDGAPPQPPPPAESWLSGFRPDRPDATKDDDALGIKKDVEDFAELIAFSGTGMPLSVGVFGGWGSGKSSFMERLEAQIDVLAKSGGAAPSADRFLSRIVHIRFNAWHFADANLWASLTSEFFDQLRCGGHRGQKEAIHDQLVSRVNAHVRDLSKAAADSSHAVTGQQQELAEARRQRDRAVYESRRAGRAALSQALVDSLGQIYGDRKAEVRRIAGSGDAHRDMDVLVKATQSLGTIGGRLRVVLTTPFRRPLWALARLAFLIAAGVAAFWAFRAIGLPKVEAPTSIQQVLGLLRLVWSDPKVLLAAAAAVLTVCASFAVYAAPGLKLLGMVADTAATFAVQLKTVEADQLKKVLAAEARLKAAETEFDARRKADEWAGQALARYMDPSGSAGASPHLMRYVLEDDPDTRALEKEIGFIGRTRRLFQAVDRIITDDLERVAKGGAPTPEIPERIIIYIDDLDRCTYAQVYSVLQAIHLLLAFGSFVVVAAVDLDWVQKALDDQFGKSLQAAPESPAGPAAESDRRRTLAYLEKIFHLPFWLRPLAGDAASGTAYTKFVTQLTKVRAPDAPVEPPVAAAPVPTPAPEPAPDPRSFNIVGLVTHVLWPAIWRWASKVIDGKSVDPPAPTPVVESTTPTVEPVAAPSPKALQLTPEEVALLSDPALAKIGSSKPRGVLRMVNTYRIVRMGLVEPADGPAIWPLLALFAAVETGDHADLDSQLQAALQRLPNGENILRAPEAGQAAGKRSDLHKLFGQSPDLAEAFAVVANARGRRNAAISAGDCLVALRAVRRYSFNRY